MEDDHLKTDLCSSRTMEFPPTMDDCSICYETITAATGHCTLGCAHTFHTACIGKWTTQSTASCPLCRKELGDTEVIPKPIPVIQNTYVGDLNYMPYIVQIDARRGRRMRIFAGESSPRIHIGNGISVLESDVDEVMSFARVSRSSAIVALRENEGNVAEALYDLEQTEPDEEEFVPPRNPLEPTEDMLTTWALERLFSKGTLLDKDDVERVEDVRYRTSEAFRYGYWMNPEYRDIPKKRRADSL